VDGAPRFAIAGMPRGDRRGEPRRRVRRRLFASRRPGG